MFVSKIRFNTLQNKYDSLHDDYELLVADYNRQKKLVRMLKSELRGRKKTKKITKSIKDKKTH